MPVTTNQAVEALETELNRAKQELKAYETRKKALLNEVTEAHAESRIKIEEVRIETDREVCQILAALGPLKEQVATLQTLKDHLESEVQRLKTEQVEIETELRRQHHVAKAEADRLVIERQHRLDHIAGQYETFLKSLPPNL
jgi:chromosome segregation ATPase